MFKKFQAPKSKYQNDTVVWDTLLDPPAFQKEHHNRALSPFSGVMPITNKNRAKDGQLLFTVPKPLCFFIAVPCENTTMKLMGKWASRLAYSLFVIGIGRSCSEPIEMGLLLTIPI